MIKHKRVLLSEQLKAEQLFASNFVHQPERVLRTTNIEYYEIETRARSFLANILTSCPNLLSSTDQQILNDTIAEYEWMLVASGADLLPKDITVMPNIYAQMLRDHCWELFGVDGDEIFSDESVYIRDQAESIFNAHSGIGYYFAEMRHYEQPKKYNHVNDDWQPTGFK